MRRLSSPLSSGVAHVEQGRTAFLLVGASTPWAWILPHDTPRETTPHHGSMDAFPTRPDYEYRRARRPTRRLGRRGGTSCADAQNDGTPGGLPRAAWPAPLATLLTGQERRTPSPCSRRVRTRHAWAPKPRTRGTPAAWPAWPAWPPLPLAAAGCGRPGRRGLAAVRQRARFGRCDDGS